MRDTAKASDPEALRSVVIVPWRRRFDFRARAIERDLEARGVSFVRIVRADAEPDHG